MLDDDPRLGAFFDTLSNDYTAVIERCFPRYREMLWALLDYLPSDRTFSDILELGCGTGNLSLLLAERFPQSTLQLVDISGESLETCRARFADRQGPCSFVRDDFRSLRFEPQSFDLVVSSISIHHLRSDEKRTLFEGVHAWLRPGGLFAVADQFRGMDDAIYARHIANWKLQSLAAGASEEEFAMWMEHQDRHDHHDTLSDQQEWLAEAGFTGIDCLWRYLLWAVVHARR